MDGLRNDGKRQRQRDAAEQRLAASLGKRAADRRSSRLRRGGVALAIVSVVALVFVGLSRVTGSDPGARAAFDRGTSALDISLPAFAGGTVSSAALKGKPTVINFYASWCTVCDGELPAFERVHQQLGDRVSFLGVNPQSNDSDKAQAAMIARTGVTYATVRDRADDLLRLFNTTGSLPTTLFVDASGKVVEAHNGGYDEQTLSEAVTRFLGVDA